MKLLITLLTFALTMSFANEKRVVLITGASSGVGLATAKAFAARGWSVWASMRNLPSDQERENGFHYIRIDVTDEQTIVDGVACVMQDEGKIDLLINNAGYGLYGTEETVSVAQAKRLFDTNLFGVMRMIQAVVPHMRERGSGHILNVSCKSTEEVVAGFGLYASSKMAVEGITKSLAIHLAPWNIKVSLIQPDFIATDFSKNLEMGDRKLNLPHYNQLAKRLPRLVNEAQKTAQSSDEIAELIISISDTAN